MTEELEDMMAHHKKRLLMKHRVMGTDVRRAYRSIRACYVAGLKGSSINDLTIEQWEVLVRVLTYMDIHIAIKGTSLNLSDGRGCRIKRKVKFTGLIP